VSDIINRKYASQIEEARLLGNRYNPDVYGRFPWDRSERRGKALGLSKTGLGEFVYAVPKNGGDITNFFCLAPQYHNSSVFPRVWLSMGAKKTIEAETAYRFDPPPVADVS
jgi:hypothetical protein